MRFAVFILAALFQGKPSSAIKVANHQQEGDVNSLAEVQIPPLAIAGGIALNAGVSWLFNKGADTAINYAADAATREAAEAVN